MHPQEIRLVRRSDDGTLTLPTKSYLRLLDEARRQRDVALGNAMLGALSEQIARQTASL